MRQILLNAYCVLCSWCLGLEPWVSWTCSLPLRCTQLWSVLWGRRRGCQKNEIWPSHGEEDQRLPWGSDIWAEFQRMNKQYFSLMEQAVSQTNKRKKHSMFKELKESRQGCVHQSQKGRFWNGHYFHQLVSNFKTLGPWAYLLQRLTTITKNINTYYIYISYILFLTPYSHCFFWIPTYFTLE